MKVQKKTMLTFMRYKNYGKKVVNCQTKASLTTKFLKVFYLVPTFYMHLILLQIYLFL